MTDVWIWKVFEVDSPESAIEQVDVTGYDVECRDGDIGRIDEATYEAGASWIVVDTGFWIFGKKRMIPAGLVERVDPDDRKVYLACDKAWVKDAPDYDSERADMDPYREEVGGYFSRDRYEGLEGDPIAPTPGTMHVTPPS